MYRLTANDRVYLSAPPTFDPFLLDLLIALRAGATIVLVAPALRHSPERLISQLFDNISVCDRVTVMPLTPTLLYCVHNALLRSAGAASSLRLLIVGGEPCTGTGVLQRLRSALCQPLRVIQVYGLTEISCWSMAYELCDTDYAAHNTGLPLGRLLDPECRWLLYDSVLGAEITKVLIHFVVLYHTAKYMFSLPSLPQPQPAKSVGELVLHSPLRFTYPIGTDQSTADEQLPLHTGDLVECDTDGHLHYLTRGDRQIKRHGIRVCTAAVERHCIRSAVAGVLAVRCVWHGGSLMLFVRCDSTPDRQPAHAVRAAVITAMRTMPPGQVPDEVYCTNRWPLTRHSKFDWRQLWAELNGPPIEKESLSQVFEQHVIDRLQLCAGDWRTRSFTSLGGTSIEAMYAVTKLTQRCNEGRHPRSMPADLLGQLLDAECPVQRIMERLQSVGERTFTVDSAATADPAAAPIRWSVNMGKCIDATATVLTFGDREYIAIGSHSHRLLTLRAADGTVQCSLLLPDRIEARVRRFGGAEHSWAACGCYDGNAYAYDFMSGERLWTVRCGAMIKARPLWTAAGDSLLWCSYLAEEERSCNVWCVDAQTGGSRWRRRLGDKSICASPIWCTDDEACTDEALVCTLDGTYARLDARNGAIVWQRGFGAAVFGTPRCLAIGSERLTVVADVSGAVHCIAAVDGSMRWQFRADGNIFSSVKTWDAYVIFGCQDGYVYCLSAENGGSLQWRCRLDAPVFSTPLVLDVVDGSDAMADQSALLAASTAGELVRMDVRTGRVQRRWRMPVGEVFSSPVALSDGGIVLGSRDDFVYCVDVRQRCGVE